MLKILKLYLFSLVFIISCAGGANKVDKFPAETNSSVTVDAEKVKNKKIYERYTRKELNEKFDMELIGDGGLGKSFGDEFPELKSVYNLDELDSEILGKWIGFNYDWEKYRRSYYFFPNKLFIVHFVPNCYPFHNTDTSINKGIGVWEIKDNMIVAQMYSFFIKTVNGRTKIELVNVNPYEIEIVRIDDIDTEGYSRRPFKKFKLPDELRDKVKIYENREKEITDEDDYLRLRKIYNIDIISYAPKQVKDYGYFTIAPKMAEEDVSGLDVVQSEELIKKYIWGLWP